MAGPRLHVAPRGLFTLEIVCQQNFLLLIRAAVAHAGGIIGVPFGEFLRFQRIDAAILIGQKIKRGAWQDCKQVKTSWSRR